MKIAALVSGGVDSSVALKLLEGHDVTAYYLKIWLEDELSSLADCPWEEDLQYVRKVCNQLNVPLKVLNLQEEYHKKVVSYTISEANAGRTPNPDVLCNKHIKFGVFLDAIGNQYDKVATGHYAQIIDGNLLRAPDEVKDQTYFLCNLSKDQINKIIFPIGHLNKSEVRNLAQKYNLPNKDRKDSQGICFLGRFKFKDFLKHHLGTKPGKFLEYETNKFLGTHDGHFYYTTGQRRNIQLSGGPWYVVKKDPKTNRVYLSCHYNSLTEPRKTFEVESLHWFNTKPPSSRNLQVKVRHRSNLRDCIFEHSNNKAKVTLTELDQGIAPGQFAVFYDGDKCLGSGIIRE